MVTILLQIYSRIWFNGSQRHLITPFSSERPLEYHRYATKGVSFVSFFKDVVLTSQTSLHM